MLWTFFALMALAALFALAWPLYRTEQRLSGRSLMTFAVVVLGSAGLYQQIGQPDAIDAAPRAPSAAAGEAPADVEAMVASLASRLEENPDDVNGWKMLGRSYGVLRRYPEAIDALERAMALQNGSDAQTIVDLGEVVLMNDNGAMSGRAGELFESAITIGPENPKAQFYAGMAAAERGNTMLAAERWQQLLDTGPPPEIAGMLESRIAQWRGEPVPAAAAVAAAPVATATALNITVSLADVAEASLDPNASVFVIARDPAQPSPPIAVARRKAGELPLDITMTDADAMIPGRVLGNFESLEILARVSSSGQPMAQPGDWFGSQVIDTSESQSVSIRIDQQVP